MMVSPSILPIAVLADVNDVRIFRDQLCQWIETAIAILDAIDGDADFESETGFDQDFNVVTLNPENRMLVKRITKQRTG